MMLGDFVGASYKRICPIAIMNTIIPSGWGFTPNDEMVTYQCLKGGEMEMGGIENKGRTFFSKLEAFRPCSGEYAKKCPVYIAEIRRMEDEK